MCQDRRGERYLGFRIGDELFAVNAPTVRLIVSPARLEPLPAPTELVAWVVPLPTGARVPVIDLGLGLVASAVLNRSAGAVIVVELLHGSPLTAGLLVDEVLESIELEGLEQVAGGLRDGVAVRLARSPRGHVTMIDLPGTPGGHPANA